MDNFRKLRDTVRSLSCKGVDTDSESQGAISWPKLGSTVPWGRVVLPRRRQRTQPPIPPPKNPVFQIESTYETLAAAFRHLQQRPSTPSLGSEFRLVAVQRRSTVGSPSSLALPTEIWCNIIDYLQYDWSALLIWYKHVIVLSSREDVRRLSRCARERVLSTRAVQVRGDDHASLGHLETFAAMLSGQLQDFNELQIVDGIWRTDVLHVRILFRCLSTFTGIRRLTLRNVNFPSAMELAGMLVALPNLFSLECVNISTRVPPSRPCKRLRRAQPLPNDETPEPRRRGCDPGPRDASVSTAFMGREDVKVATNLFRSPSLAGRFILTIHDGSCSYSLLKQCCMEVLRPDASVQNMCIKAAPRVDPRLELSFLCSVVNAVISSVTGRVEIVGLVDPREPYSDWKLFPPSNSYLDWDPEDILSIRHIEPAETAAYVVALNLPLWESRSRLPLRDSWRRVVARHMELMPEDRCSLPRVQFYEHWELPTRNDEDV